ILGGRISRHYENELDRAFPGGDKAALFRLLVKTLDTDNRSIDIAHWRKRLGSSDRDFNTTVGALNESEVVSSSSGVITMDPDDLVLTDYIRGRASIEIDKTGRALAVGEMLTANVKRAPKLMARSYRLGSAIGLRDLLGAFDGRQISPALIDYSRFRAELKGAADDKVLKAVREDNDRITLPHIIYTAETAYFYPSLNELCDPERSAVAIGFSGTAEKEETAWIAAAIVSKLEAGRDIAEFWCDRLEMVAASCGFSRFTIWLIAPEGFDERALEVLRTRNAYGSSRKQAELLAGILNAPIKTTAAAPQVDEYEIVVPMGHATEMIAAHTVEEIAKRHKFPAKAINQIKTALVEACINASEHSLSPDRRIYQKFVVAADRMTIIVTNRGLRLADKLPAANAADEGRRGWGLKLIKGLMDDVTIESTDDGTRLTMVKHISR
ncbi:MAG: ATP-binding protein, partial [Pyrinomonadaceae bacterium]